MREKSKVRKVMVKMWEGWGDINRKNGGRGIE